MLLQNCYLVLGCRSVNGKYMANGKSEEPADFPYIIFHFSFFIGKTGYTLHPNPRP